MDRKTSKTAGKFGWIELYIPSTNRKELEKSQKGKSSKNTAG